MKKHLTAGRIIRYLLYISIACTLVSGVTYARYYSEIQGSGTVTAAAVAMNTTLELTEQLQGMHPGETRTVNFDVTNKKGDVISEVAQEYSISVSTTGNLPLTYSLASTGGGDGNYVTSGSFSAGTSPVWTGGRLPYSQQGVTHTYTLTINWPETENIPWYMNEIDVVSLTVNARQSQPTEK